MFNCFSIFQEGIPYEHFIQVGLYKNFQFLFDALFLKCRAAPPRRRTAQNI